MSGRLWVALISAGGLVLGGLLSFRVQHATQRSTQRTTLAETRRGEQLTLLERFIELGALAERAAFDRPSTEWAQDDPWAVTTQDVMNRLWVAERMIRIQFPLPVHDAARAYFLDLNRTVWQGLPEGESVRDYLEHNRLAFLDSARAAIDN
ncbi:MAG TPA: hypothetical protein VJ914_13210 [Pseudonocardiaceae bacterium]|nr:hypothetical protein [Pseudonocardiaceae bacterium]